MTLVDLVKALNTLRTDTILQLIREVVKKPHQIKGDQVSHTFTKLSKWGHFIDLYCFYIQLVINTIT